MLITKQKNLEDKNIEVVLVPVAEPDHVWNNLYITNFISTFDESTHWVTYLINLN